MRLINASTLELEEFFEDRLPPYAILSHRWQDDEVSLHDVQNGKAREKGGFTKIQLICDEAIKRDLKYAWVDTCCIDKSSSAELSEAINSMYKWYKNAVICCVYLYDVIEIPLAAADYNEFRNSSWWSRGWTLQELIAPPEVEFFTSRWTSLGTKSELKHSLAEGTGIDIGVLDGKSPEECSIAQRMAWASRRSTTRSEDLAYCLLGIFGVNMPLLYGEGDRAFIRLQEEIMKHSDDHSLFAWRFNDDRYHGLLAKSPEDFEGCHNVVAAREKLNYSPYSITNMGLSMELLMLPWAMETYLVALDCGISKQGIKTRIGIFLRYTKEKHQMARICVDGSDRCSVGHIFNGFEPKKIYVRQSVSLLQPYPMKKYAFWVRTLPETIRIKTGSHFTQHVLVEVTSRYKWSYDDRVLEIPVKECGTAGVFWYRSITGISLLKLGFDSGFNPVCLLEGLAWGHGSTAYRSQVEMKQTERVKLSPKWFSEPGKKAVLVGDRLNGMKQRQFGTNVSIRHETFSDYTMWVVDIDQVDNAAEQPRHEDVQCDGCWTEGFRSTRYKCNECDNFDLCQDCYLKVERTHPGGHTFTEIQKPEAGTDVVKIFHGEHNTNAMVQKAIYFQARSNMDAIRGGNLP